MVDIEKKTYKLVYDNIDTFDKVLFDYDYIKQYVYGNPEQIEWSSIKTLELFIQIATKLLEKGELFEFLCILNRCSFKDCEDTDILLFYSLLERLRKFLKKVFDIFLLDQYLYILTTLKEEDFTYEVLSKPIVTGSFYEANSFGLNYFQTGLVSEQVKDKFDQQLYFIKEWYQNQISKLLTNNYYRLKRSHFIEAINKLLLIHKNNEYFDAFCVNFYSLISVPKYKVKGIKAQPSSPDQYSLFKK